ncbi:hypothetical protein B0H13DRAFT_1997548 [Mycena leptocephala]|nr:hypothetical protein B0H13DRAFT_1997548 [Mycena leptocephala]
MSDFTLVDPRGWEYDLHSVYSAYIGYFQVNNIAWYDRSWGHLFSTFEDFLAFSWPVITCTDTWTGRAHVVTRLTSIGAFLKMIKTRYVSSAFLCRVCIHVYRFGETLPQAPNILQVSPFETASRHLRTVSDYASYKKLHSTLPAAVLSALKLRWSERNEKSCLEWGYAAVRCGHLEALGHWPPVPDANYRKGHYIVQEYVDKVINKHCPTHPWQYAFGDSQVCPKAKLPQIIQAVISSLASPDSETIPNTLVLVAQGSRALFAGGHRPAMIDPHTSTPGNPKPRNHGSTLSLENLLRSLPSPSDPQAHNPALQTQVLVPGQFPQPGAMVPGVVLHNSGNDAFMCLYGLQLLLQPEGTQVPVVQKKVAPRPLYMHARTNSGSPLPPSPIKHGNGNGSGNGNATMGRSSRRLSAMPTGDGWTSVRRG